MSKDLFSEHAADYAAARPTYPQTLFDALADLAPGRRLAWDCATGNGQAAVPLVARFETVWATDLSPQQLAQAPPHPRITWREARAEDSGLADASADLITAAQAYHWFDHAAFHAEARRVLRPGGILAVWCYNLSTCAPELDALARELYRTVAPWWEPERRFVEEGYASIPWPFEPVAVPAFEMRHEWILEHFLAYLGTWSALRTCRKTTGADPLAADLAPALRAAWGGARTRQILWSLSLRVGRCG